MVKTVSILDRPLSKGKNEINLSTFAVLFSELVTYSQKMANNNADLIHAKLVSYGRFVGARMLDVIVLREKGYKRDIKLLGMLMFIKSTVWKNLFGKEADRLERSNEDQRTYLLIEKEPIVNTFISAQNEKDGQGLNCAGFIAGIVESMLELSNFPCEVRAHWHEGTTYVIQFDESVIAREKQMV